MLQGWALSEAVELYGSLGGEAHRTKALTWHTDRVGMRKERVSGVCVCVGMCVCVCVYVCVWVCVWGGEEGFFEEFQLAFQAFFRFFSVVTLTYKERETV